MSRRRVEQALTSLGFVCEDLERDALGVTVPYWRSDINIEDDLVEEVARIIGYDEVPTTTLSAPIPPYQPEPLLEFRDRVKDVLVACGMQEVITYSVTSLEHLAKVKALNGGNTPLKLANPMSVQQEYLRTTLRGSLLSTLAANRLHQEGSVTIFESGRVYLPRDGSLPEEREIVAGVLSGPRWESHWLSGEGALGYYDAKGTVEGLLEELGLAATYEPSEDPVLHPGKCASVRADDVHLGTVGEVHPSVLEDFGIEKGPVAIFELDIADLLGAMPQDRAGYRPLNRFPSATRDLSVIVEHGIPAAKVESIIAGHPLVARAVLFDVYAGPKIPVGKRSLAYNIYFQSPERTLTAEDVNHALEDVLGSLEREVGAQLRG